jgi:mono/diheme cytochrome c family protein
MKPSFIVTIVALLASCGGGRSSSPSSETTTPVEQDNAAPPAAEDMAFHDMTKEQRATFMKETVTPTMKQLFQEFDSKRFGEFNCKTCHGSGAVDGTFKMPSPDIARLPNEADFMAWAEKPENKPAVEFMAMKVKPTMAKLLKMSEYDPATKSGDFSCGNCHMSQGQ